MREPWRSIARTLIAGTTIGLIVLGIGGRLVMAWIAAEAGGTPRFTVGGTMTVVMLGAASGFAGAAIAIASRTAAERWTPRTAWLQYILLGALLLLVTMRGLRGTPQPGSLYFYPLVAIYGVALAWLMRRSPRAT